MKFIRFCCSVFELFKYGNFRLVEGANALRARMESPSRARQAEGGGSVDSDGANGRQIESTGKIPETTDNDRTPKTETTDGKEIAKIQPTETPPKTTTESLINISATEWTIWDKLIYFGLAILIVLGTLGIRKFFYDLTINLMKRTAPPMRGTLGRYDF